MNGFPSASVSPLIRSVYHDLPWCSRLGVIDICPFYHLVCSDPRKAPERVLQTRRPSDFRGQRRSSVTLVPSSLLRMMTDPRVIILVIIDESSDAHHFRVSRKQIIMLANATDSRARQRMSREAAARSNQTELGM